jgi:hypothetical protein
MRVTSGGASPDFVRSPNIFCTSPIVLLGLRRSREGPTGFLPLEGGLDVVSEDPRRALR